jgi:hypothetical protein
MVVAAIRGGVCFVAVEALLLAAMGACENYLIGCPRFFIEFISLTHFYIHPMYNFLFETLMSYPIFQRITPGLDIVPSPTIAASALFHLISFLEIFIYGAAVGIIARIVVRRI